MVFNQREKRVVFAHANIVARVHFGTALTHNDVTRENLLAAEFFYTQTTTDTVTAYVILCHRVSCFR